MPKKTAGMQSAKRCDIHPNAFVAVTGCYAQTRRTKLQTVPGIDLIVGTQFKMNLPDYLPTPSMFHKQPTPEQRHSRTINHEDFTLPDTASSDSTRTLLKLRTAATLCAAFASFPLLVGRPQPPLEDVLREARDLAAHGYPELVAHGREHRPVLLLEQPYFHKYAGTRNDPRCHSPEDFFDRAHHSACQHYFS